ncbi:hypothetical protein [Pseudopelagicola sp. nBUS_19]|uniref:hypothetical protein n=1 Tax=Pseudopelagicola sp. nBUS_19 TaxID=3395316 RepID=UPI003EC05E91
MRYFIKIVITVTATFCATAVLAEKFTGYGSIDGWNVYVDTEKNTCMVEVKDDFGNVVQMGVTDQPGIAYIGIFTNNKTDIRKDQKQDIALLIGDDVYVGQATGMRGNITKGYSGGYVKTDDPEIFDAIAKAQTMTIFPETGYSVVVDLTGSFNAIKLGRKCMAER